MSEDKNIPSPLIEMITSQTTYEDLPKIIEGFLTEEDVNILGEKEIFSQKIARSISFLGAFAPSPATFGQNDFFTIAIPRLPEEKQKRIWEIHLRLGTIKKEMDNLNKPRGSVSNQLKEIITSQLVRK